MLNSTYSHLLVQFEAQFFFWEIQSEAMFQSEFGRIVNT